MRRRTIVVVASAVPFALLALLSLRYWVFSGGFLVELAGYGFILLAGTQLLRIPKLASSLIRERFPEWLRAVLLLARNSLSLGVFCTVAAHAVRLTETRAIALGLACPGLVLALLFSWALIALGWSENA